MFVQTEFGTTRYRSSASIVILFVSLALAESPIRRGSERNSAASQFQKSTLHNFFFPYLSRAEVDCFSMLNTPSNKDACEDY